MSGMGVGSSKRCPRCGALAGLNAPVCVTCGRAFRGTVGQGASAGPSPVAGPPPLLVAPGLDSSPLDAPASGAPDEDAAAGLRLSLILIAAFVVGTVLLAILASVIGRRDTSGPVVRPSVVVPSSP